MSDKRPGDRSGTSGESAAGGERRSGSRHQRKGQLGREGVERLLVPAGLCETCSFLEIQASARSAFVRCGRSDTDSRFARYPRLPVLACPGYRDASAEAEER